MRRYSLDKRKIKCLLLEGVHPSAVDVLARDGYVNVVRHADALTGSDLVDASRDAHFIGIRSRTRLARDVLEGAQKLMAVGCFCIGTDQVDLADAARRGIPVFNAPFSSTRSVAELVIAETILLMRGVSRKSRAAHRGVWLKSADAAFEIRGKTMGIVGYGHIGTQVGILAEALGLDVVFFDIETKLPLGNTRQLPSLDELLRVSDVVTLHVPDTPLTKNMIAAPQLATMRAGSHLVNASRGTVVEIDALVAAIESGHVAGAAIDVFPKEPKGHDEEFVSPLRKFDNVILTPHIGGSTVEAQANIGAEVASKFIRYSNNGSTLTAVNFPEVSLPEHAGKCRLLHIHRNEPGVLARVNEVFSANDINIAAQYLQTNEHVGYVVIDIDDDSSHVALEQLSRIPGTIRCRILY